MEPVRLRLTGANGMTAGLADVLGRAKVPVAIVEADGPADALVVGPGHNAPIKAVQQAQIEDRRIAMLILVAPEELGALRGEAMFAPMLSKDLVMEAVGRLEEPGWIDQWLHRVHKIKAHRRQLARLAELV